MQATADRCMARNRRADQFQSFADLVAFSGSGRTKSDAAQIGHTTFQLAQVDAQRAGECGFQFRI